VKVDPRTETLARAAFALLVVATFAAFFITQRLKHEPPVVFQPLGEHYFVPGSAVHPFERIAFRIKRTDDVTVTVIDSRGQDVATLISGRLLEGYKRLHLRWYGLTYRGALAPPGTYRIRITLRRQARQVIPDFSFELRAAP
jgi:hypothetical protein